MAFECVVGRWYCGCRKECCRRVWVSEVEVPDQNNQRQGPMSDLATLKEYCHSETSSIVKTDTYTCRNMIFNGRTNTLVFTSWLC
jgi:DNA-directed RNA polymerase subunit N (RpoN/RPB10)